MTRFLLPLLLGFSLPLSAQLPADSRGKGGEPGREREMYRVLTRIYWNGYALSQLPPWVQAASKQGAVDQSDVRTEHPWRPADGTQRYKE